VAELPEIAERFDHILDERAGIVAAEITTARPLPEELKRTLHDALASATGRTVRLTFATDEAIIGGVMARIGSTIFDGSVQNHLDRLAAGLAGS
jgi:F-type H+-transporting ATPase subunit delta